MSTAYNAAKMIAEKIGPEPAPYDYMIGVATLRATVLGHTGNDLGQYAAETLLSFAVEQFAREQRTNRALAACVS